MFLHLLNDTQKTKFLVFAHKLAMCDGEDTSQEEDMLLQLQQEMETDIKVPMAEVLGEIDVRAFSTMDARVIAMIELLMVAYTDNYVHEAEAELISDIAHRFGFSQQMLDRLVDWAGRALALGDRPDEAAYNRLVEEAYKMMGY